MSGLQIYKKPHLAVISETKKLRDYEETERLTLATKLVGNLLNDLGVGKNSDTNHHIRAIKFINDSLGNYTPEEVEEAFKLFIMGKFQIEAYQQLNPLIIGRVISQFEEYKKQKLDKYRKEQAKLKVASEMDKLKMDNTQKKEYNNATMQQSYAYFLKTSSIDTSRIYAYAILEEYGYVNLDESYKKSVKKDAIDILKNEYSGKKGRSRDEHNDFKNIVKNLSNGGEKGMIISKCKEIAITDIYRKFSTNSDLLDKFRKEFKITL